MTTQVLTIDIKGFHRRAQFLTPAETAQYLVGFYRYVLAMLPTPDWRLVKTMGDCVVVVAATNAAHSQIQALHSAVSQRYPVTTHARLCHYAETPVRIGAYTCQDIFGQDLNQLFLHDAATTRLD